MPIIAETWRLILRTWLSSDRSKLDQHCNTEPVMEHLGGRRQTPKELEEDCEWFEECQEKYGHTLWVVERKSAGKAHGEFLGFCGLDKLIYNPEWKDGVPKNLHNEVEVGWRFRQDAWGNGFTTEAARVSLDIAFRIRRMERVVSRVAANNDASKAVMRKLGLVRTKDLDRSAKTLVFGIDQATWLMRR